MSIVEEERASPSGEVVGCVRDVEHETSVQCSASMIKGDACDLQQSAQGQDSTEHRRSSCHRRGSCDGPSSGYHVGQSAPDGPASSEGFGVGAMIGSKSMELSAPGQHETSAGALFVLKLEVGGPAKLSGQVREGDQLLAVDKQKVAGLTSQAVAELLHGAHGSLVKLRLRRKDIIFDVCLQRDAARPEPPMRKTRTLNPVRETEGAAEVLEKLYRSFARVNNARVVSKPEKMSPEETKAFHAAQQDKAKRQESIAKRCLDAAKRRRAEIGVLKRELQALEKQDAPFSQVLEYKNWIRRLEIEDDLGPMQTAALDQLELEAEELELVERAEYLSMTLSLLEAQESGTSWCAAVCGGDHGHESLPGVPPASEAVRDGSAGEGDGCDEHRAETQGPRVGGWQDRPEGNAHKDIEIIKAKLRRVEEQLDLLRGVQAPNTGDRLGHQNTPAARCRGEPAEGEAGDEGDAAPSTLEHGVSTHGAAGQVNCNKSSEGLEHWEGLAKSEASASSTIAGLAAELGSKWDSHGAEPREGARAAAEGTLEEAPEPCMLAQGTIDTAQRLWKFGLH